MKRELNDQIRDNNFTTHNRLRHKLFVWRLNTFIAVLIIIAQSINIIYSGCSV